MFLLRFQLQQMNIMENTFIYFLFIKQFNVVFLVGHEVYIFKGNTKL